MSHWRRLPEWGLRIFAGFIIGFDDEKKGAGKRVFDFVTENNLPGVTFSMLQALPGTGLWDRLKKEGRLLDDANLTQTTLINFVPSRPVEEVATEYMDTFWDLYDPKNYLKRTYEHFRMVGTAKVHSDPELRKKLANKHKTDIDWRGLIFLLKIIWKQGMLRSTRFVFWKYLWGMWKHNRGGIGNYLSFSLFIEHFLPYRKAVKKEIQEQLRLRAEGKVPVKDPEIELKKDLADEVEWYQAS